MHRIRLSLLLMLPLLAGTVQAVFNGGALAGQRFRAVISTDVGGTEADQAEVFGVVELALPIPAGVTRANSARMVFDGRIPAVASNDGRVLRFRFAPRDAKVWPYVIQSDFAGLDGRSGKFAAVPPPAERASRPASAHPNWWIDDPNAAAAEGIHPGAKSVNRWRQEFLCDFAARMLRCRTPAQHP